MVGRFVVNFAGYGLAFAVGDLLAQRRRQRRAADRLQMSRRAAAAIADLVVLDGELRGLVEPEPFDVTDVIAAHSCVCCRSGAATWPAT